MSLGRRLFVAASLTGSACWLVLGAGSGRIGYLFIGAGMAIIGITARSVK